MGKAGRGVLYVVWGEVDRAILERSQVSLRQYHPDLPIEVAELEPGATLLDKARMMDLSPFEETLFLDMDTVVLGNLDFGFEKARQFGLALCICECPWARRYGGIEGDVVEYNTGVLFFTEKAAPVFEAWKRIAPEIDSSIIFKMGGEHHRMPLNDQGGFAQAMEEVGEETGFAPFVLPQNWNFRPRWQMSWYGPLKIWHDYEPPPPPLLEHNAAQSEPDSVVVVSSLKG